MAVYTIQDTTLSAIADAIREKNGKSDLIVPTNMPTEIRSIKTGGGGGADIEPIVLSGVCDYACASNIASTIIKNFGDKVSTNDITDAANMFYKSTLERIPFALNFKSTTKASLKSLFEDCEQLKEISAINNAYPDNLGNLFSSCFNIRYLPEDLGVNWNWKEVQTYNYAGIANVFSNCYSLRKIPEYFLSNFGGVQTSSSYSPYKYLVNECNSLDEINNIRLLQSTLTSNMFSSTFYKCFRLKNITFAINEDGTPKTVNWKSQTIDCQSYVGYFDNQYKSRITNYNSGITADKEVVDDTTYQALKNDPDWFTGKIEYSRYNHDSAVNTINSLPDTSAYLASAGGTNTIKFKGASGSLTDGGAINTLTEEEIAVATAKGWTVSLV